MTTKEDFLSHFLKKKSYQTEVDLKILYEEMMDDGAYKQAEELRKKAEEHGYLIQTCDLCDGRGEMPDYYYDSDTREWYEDGFKKCICRI